MKKFLKGKNIQGYIISTLCKPMNEKDEKYAKQLDVWEVRNVKSITWINNSVDNSIIIQLSKYETIEEIWEHLQRLYMQSNFAKQYQLEIDI